MKLQNYIYGLRAILTIFLVVVINNSVAENNAMWTSQAFLDTG